MNRDVTRIFGVVALCSLAAAAAGAGGFRGNEWGASQSEVKALEKHPLHHDRPGELAYFGFQLAGVEAGLVYRFEEDRLVSAYYLSRHRTPDPEEDYADYRTWLEAFDQHFGEHAEQEWVWREGVEPAAEGLDAVTSGDARLVTRWITADARVRLVMEGEDGRVSRVRAYFEPLE